MRGSYGTPNEDRHVRESLRLTLTERVDDARGERETRIVSAQILWRMPIYAEKAFRIEALNSTGRYLIRSTMNMRLGYVEDEATTTLTMPRMTEWRNNSYLLGTRRILS